MSKRKTWIRDSSFGWRLSFFSSANLRAEERLHNLVSSLSNSSHSIIFTSSRSLLLKLSDKLRSVSLSINNYLGTNATRVLASSLYDKIQIFSYHASNFHQGNRKIRLEEQSKTLILEEKKIDHKAMIAFKGRALEARNESEKWEIDSYEWNWRSFSGWFFLQF